MSYNKAGGAVPDTAGRRKGKGNGPEMFSGAGAWNGLILKFQLNMPAAF